MILRGVFQFTEVYSLVPTEILRGRVTFLGVCVPHVIAHVSHTRPAERMKDKLFHRVATESCDGASYRPQRVFFFPHTPTVV